MDLNIVFKIGVRSQEFCKSPQLQRVGKDTLLQFDYETETGEYSMMALRFVDAVVYKVTRMVCVEPWMISAYDAVAVVPGSKWMSEVLPDSMDGYNHYVVFFEDYGCHEFIAKDAVGEPFE